MPGRRLGSGLGGAYSLAGSLVCRGLTGPCVLCPHLPLIGRDLGGCRIWPTPSGCRSRASGT